MTRAPEWSMRAFSDFIESQRHHRKLLEVCKRGIFYISSTKPRLIEVLRSPDEPVDEQRDAEIKSEAALADSELKNDFPTLHSQFVVTLWSSLENLIFTVVEDRLLNEPSLFRSKPWCDLKVRVGEFVGLDDHQRASHLASLMDQALSAPLKGGVNRFEALMAAIGLTGVVPEELGKAIFELQQVRNLLVHQRGIADKRFVSSCPWLGASVGVTVHVGSSMCNAYLVAVLAYVGELVCRNAEHFGDSDTRKTMFSETPIRSSNETAGAPNPAPEG